MDNLANFLSISPNQTKFLPSGLPVPAGLFCQNTGSVSTHGVGRGDGSWWRLVTQQADKPNDIGRNFLLGNRKKTAKFLMRTFTYRSIFFYENEAVPPPPRSPFSHKKSLNKKSHCSKQQSAIVLVIFWIFMFQDLCLSSQCYSSSTFVSCLSSCSWLSPSIRYRICTECRGGIPKEKVISVRIRCIISQIVLIFKGTVQRDGSGRN